MAQDIIRIRAIRRGRNQTEAHHKQTTAAAAVAIKREKKTTDNKVQCREVRLGKLMKRCRSLAVTATAAKSHSRYTVLHI